MSVVVVSNRVARAKTDEPVAGGLAAALMPMVSTPERPGSAPTYPPTMRYRPGMFLRSRAPRQRRPGDVDLPARHYRNYYEGFANSALMAGAAFAS